MYSPYPGLVGSLSSALDPGIGGAVDAVSAEGKIVIHSPVDCTPVDSRYLVAASMRRWTSTPQRAAGDAMSGVVQVFERLSGYRMVMVDRSLGRTLVR